jgi:hypothetical protein
MLVKPQYFQTVGELGFGLTVISTLKLPTVWKIPIMEIESKGMARRRH